MNYQELQHRPARLDRGSDRGSALVISLFVLMIVSIIGLAITFSSMQEVGVSRNYQTSGEAFYIAEAGLNHAIDVIQDNSLKFETVLQGADGILGTADDGILAGNHVPVADRIPATGRNVGTGNYRVVIKDGSGGAATRLVITSTGTGPNNSTSTVEAILGSSGTSVDADEPNIPVPGYNTDAAALNFLGDLNKKGKFDFHVKYKYDDENGNDASGSSLPIAVNGYDMPGVAIEDETTYNKVTKDFAKRIADHKIPAGSIIGNPMNTIGEGSNKAEASFKRVGNPVLASDAMHALGDHFYDVVANQLIPDPNTIRISGGDLAINTPATWGDNSMSVTYIDATRITVSGTTVVGRGTLIVGGDLRLSTGATFDFDGNIYVLGGSSKDAILQNNRGSMTVDGNVVVLGTPKNIKKSIFKLEDDHDDNSAVTTINGSVLVLTGNNTDQEEKAEFRAKNGTITINGLVSLVGDKLKFEAKMKDEATFRLYGAVALSVPGDDGKYKAKVHLHGDEILIDYNQANIQLAVQKLNNMTDPSNNPILDPLALPTAQRISWREVRK